jgi:hypothetical protein
MQSLGRTLQYAGLTIPPVSMIMGLMGMFQWRTLQMPGMLLFSVILFIGGRMIEGYAAGR